MTWRRVFVGIFLLFVVLLAGAMWWGLPRLEQWGLREAEKALSEATKQPVSIEGLSLQLVPVSAALHSFTIGDKASPALQVSGVEVHLHTIESLKRLHVVLSVQVGSVGFDATRWPPGEAAPAQEEARRKSTGILPLPPVVITPIQIGKVHVVVPPDAQPTEIDAPEVSASVEAGPTRLQVGLKSHDIRIRRGGNQVAVSQLDVRGGENRNGLTLQKLVLQSDLGSVQAAPEEPQVIGVQAHLDLNRLISFLSPGIDARGSLALSGTIRGSLETPQVEATVDVDNPGYDTYDVQHLQLVARMPSLQKLEVSKLAIQAKGMEADGHADLSLADPYAIDAAISTQGVDLQKAFQLLGVSDLAGRGSASVELAGELSPLSVRGHLQADLAGVRRASFAGRGIDGRISADAHFAQGAGRVDAAAQLAGAHLLEVNVEVTENQSLQGKVDLSLDRAEVLKPLLPQLDGGKLESEATLAGTLKHPRIEGQIDASKLIFAGTQIDAIQGSFTGGPDALTLNSVEVREVGGRAVIDGRVALASTVSNSLSAAVDNLDLETAWVAASGLGMKLPYFKGTLNAHASAQGPWSNLILTSTLDIKPLVLETERFVEVKGTVEMRERQWQANLQVDHLPNETMTLDGSGTGTRQLALTVQSTPWALSGIRILSKSLAPVEGNAVLSGQVTGSLSRPEGRVSLALNQVAIDGRKAGDVTLQVASAPGPWNLEVRTSSDKVRVDGKVEDAAGYPFDLQAKVQNADLVTVLSPGADLAAMMDATLSAQGKLSDPVGTLDAELRVPVLDISRGQQGLRARSPIVVRGEAGHFRIESLQLEGGLGTVSASGGFELNGAAKVSVNLSVNAAVLELMGEVVTSAKGQVSLSADIEHAAGGAWGLEGQGTLSGLAVDIGLPFGLTETSGSFTMRQNQIDISKIQGKVGGGDFGIDGVVDLAAGPDIHWQFSEISTGFLPDLEDRVSGKGDFKGTWAEPQVDGHITIISMLYDRDIGLTDLIPSFRRQVSPPQPSSQGLPIKLDVRVTANDGIYIDTPFAKAEFRTDLHVTGTTNRPLIDGRVEALSGQVTVGRATLDVQEGVIEFNNRPQINPTLDFSATTDVRTTSTSYFVTARITGTLDSFRVYLSADDPSLTETDIVSLLTLGKTAAQLQSEGGGVALGDVLALAPSLYGRQVSRNITRILPVDRFEIEPAFSPVTGSFEPVLTVGKNLTERLQASVATTFASQTRNSALLEYQLTPRIVVQGTWTSRTESNAGSFGGDIKFRHRFRRIPCFSLLGLCGDEKADEGTAK